MQYSSLSLPLWHETFDVLDSTKLSTFASCPRHYFYEYLMGLRKNETNIHLGFGSAIHDALELLMNTQDGVQVGYTGEQAIAAIYKFNETFDRIFQPEEMDGINILAGVDPTNGAKDKKNAANALLDYCKYYKYDNFKTLSTELAGTILLGGDRMLYAKLDSIIEEDNGEIWSLEHKTTGRKTGPWLNEWPLKIQLGTYTHLLRTMYGSEGNVRGIKVNGMVLRPPTKGTGKANNEFVRIPVAISEEMLSLYLFEINYLIDLLDWNMVQLSKAKSSDEVMQAFPRNPTSCTKFGCPFSALCTSWANPIKHIGEVPLGMKVERWDPRTHTSE